MLETNKLIALPGIWQADYWDRYIRDEQHYFQAIEYIHNNPAKRAFAMKR